MWWSAVFAEISSRLAIWPVVRPRAAKRSTSTSRPVSPPGYEGDGVRRDRRVLPWPAASSTASVAPGSHRPVLARRRSSSAAAGGGKAGPRRVLGRERYERVGHSEQPRPRVAGL